MIFFKFLLRGSWSTIVLSGIIGLIAGISGIALIHLVRHSIRGGALPGQATLYWFLGLCVVMLISRAVSQFIMTRFTEKTVSKMLRHLCRQILRVPLRTLEQFGTMRVQKILTKDVSTIGRAMNVIPILCIKTTLIVCGLGYLVWLSPKLFACLAGFGAAAGIAYMIVSRRARRLMRSARQDKNALQRHVRQLIKGLKELKLHRPRQDAFLEKGIETTDGSLRQRNIRGAQIYALTSTFGRILGLLAIGFLLFAWPHIEQIEAGGGRRDRWNNDLFIYGFILMITMRLGGSVVTGFSLIFGKRGVATRRLEQLGITVGEFAEEASLLAGEPLNRNWERLELAGVTHSYRDTLGIIADDDDDDDDSADDPNADPTEAAARDTGPEADAAADSPLAGGEENNFVLGPIDLTLKAGEITFVVGGNGCGKSTLLKVLSGLYYPEAGEIRLDGQVIDIPKREAFRQLFSGVFDEAVVFENLWGIDPDQVDERARRYLQAFHLDREVTIEDGKFVTTNSLSIGQRKRLALVASYLEDRPIYVFDEWAANQDPLFKRVFYQSILADLKARGRTVVAVTHDDNYFHVADRIVVLRDGKVVEGSWQDNLAQRGCAIEAIAPGLNGSAAVLAAPRDVAAKRD